MKVQWEDSFLFLVVKGKEIRAGQQNCSSPSWEDNLESSAFQILCCLHYFPAVSSALSCYLLPTLWLRKHLGNVMNSKQKNSCRVFIITWPFSDWRLLPEAPTSSKDVVVWRGQLFGPTGRTSYYALVFSRTTVHWLTGASARTLHTLGVASLDTVQPKKLFFPRKSQCERWWGPCFTCQPVNHRLRSRY